MVNEDYKVNKELQSIHGYSLMFTSKQQEPKPIKYQLIALVSRGLSRQKVLETPGKIYRKYQNIGPYRVLPSRVIPVPKPNQPYCTLCPAVEQQFKRELCACKPGPPGTYTQREGDDKTQQTKQNGYTWQGND